MIVGLDGATHVTIRGESFSTRSGRVVRKTNDWCRHYHRPSLGVSAIILSSAFAISYINNLQSTSLTVTVLSSHGALRLT
jgi:hypothetical protein